MIRQFDRLPDAVRLEEVRPYFESLSKKRFQLFLKRLFDIAVALIVLVVLSPIFLVAAVSVAVSSKGSAPKTKEQKRAEAEARNRVYRKLKDERKRVAELEKQMEIDDARHEELVTLMADEALYADQERFEAAMTEYSELKARMTANEAEWLDLSATIELELKQMGEDA